VVPAVVAGTHARENQMSTTPMQQALLNARYHAQSVAEECNVAYYVERHSTWAFVHHAQDALNEFDKLAKAIAALRAALPTAEAKLAAEQEARANPKQAA